MGNVSVRQLDEHFGDFIVSICREERERGLDDFIFASIDLVNDTVKGV